jgi:hypothetical protein
MFLLEEHQAKSVEDKRAEEKICQKAPGYHRGHYQD